MQSARGKAEAASRAAKLAHSYQELLDEFSNKDLKSVGNYTLGRLIGKGSFGKVYLATHKLTNGSKVVLKSAKKEDANLAREIHHHRQFVHPHIARLYEVIVTETMVWLVLEYCPGDELYTHLLNHGKLPVDKVQRIFCQLVGAVAYVHMHACVHRDLKLENILLDKHENVKLVDFGFTREYESKANCLQTFCGTICYSAPEMLRAEKYAGEKVDVWSLGVILYALLCGELPFDDDDDDVTRRRILAEEPTYPDHLPPDALPLLRAMLSKRPLPRPALLDILAHPFLAEHAPQQQAILKLPRASPFATPLEKETLQRMRSAGVDIDAVIESVLAQRCDVLAGWWTLLIEKEQRKLARRERKRREREQLRDLEHRSSRRLSTTSSRLERLATVDEAGSGSATFVQLADPPTPRPRGRSQQRRSAHYDGLRIDDFPGLAELDRVNEALRAANVGAGTSTTAAASAASAASAAVAAGVNPPPPADKDSVRSVRSASSSRQRRPIPPPKEGVLRSARSRGSTLHLVTTTDALGPVGGLSHGRRRHGGGRGGGGDGHDSGPDGLGPDSLGVDGDGHPRVRKKTSQVIITHWKNMTHWIAESTRRSRHSTKRGSHSTPNLLPKPTSGSSSHKDGRDSKDGSPRPQTSKYPHSGSGSSGGGGGGGGGGGSGGGGSGGGSGGGGAGGGGGFNTASLPKGVVANGYASKGGGSGSGGGGGGGGGGDSNTRSAGDGRSRAVSGAGIGGGIGTGAGRGGGGFGSAHNSAVISGSSTANSPLSGGHTATTPNSLYYAAAATTTATATPRLATGHASSSSYKRQSLSPAPLTPRSTIRRSSVGAGLRGRKSTSSSVSSIRSIHRHRHSHSKASSTSSNGSVSTSMSKTPGPPSLSAGRSPHHSVKVLPATPTTTSFPNSLRLVRGGSTSSGSSRRAGSGGGGGGGGLAPIDTFNEGMPLDRIGRMPGSPNPFGSYYSGGGAPGTPVMFAKRKRNIFKGPMLSLGGGGGGGGSGGGSSSSSGTGAGSGRRGSGAGGGHTHSRSASASGLGRRSGEITIAEEDEEEDEEMMEEGDEEEMEGGDDDDDGGGALGRFLRERETDHEPENDVEEVEAFSPVIQRPGELVEEIYEDDEDAENDENAHNVDNADMADSTDNAADETGGDGGGAATIPAAQGEKIPAA